jgi:ABC-type dipeptide/oligopeptide/nickel transport system ATPase component
MSLLDVRELSVAYVTRHGRTVAVDGVSFSVEPGETVAIVGESGSGKTTLALALTRLLPTPPAEVSAARVRFEDTDLLSAAPAALRRLRGGRVAYVFQDPASSLNPVLPIGEQITEAIVLHTGRRGRAAAALAAEWLERVGLPDAPRRLRAFPHELSGGMQQRVCLAMAMASHPSLVIADEPTSALDVTIQVQILRLMRELQRQFNLALLVISHDLLVVRRISQRVVVLARGRVVETGPVEQVLARPAHPYTKSLLEARASMSWWDRA